MNTLSAVDIRKTINKKDIINGISLNLAGGKVYGVVGENGAGKSILFRILCGLVKPTSGKIIINGKDITTGRNGENIGVVIDHSAMWPNMTGFQNLKYLARINNQITDSEIIASMCRVGLDPDNTNEVRKYSLGMKQRLMLAQGIMERPDFLFLDEPTNAIDIGGLEVVRNIVREEAGRGALVLMSSHNQADIDELCSEVFYIDKGKIINHDIKKQI